MSFRLVADETAQARFRELVKHWLTWAERGGSLIDEKVGDYIRQRFTRNFEAEGYPEKWPALAPRTVAERRRKGFGGAHMILQRTRELKRSVVDRGHALNLSTTSVQPRAGRVTLTLGSSDPRFGALHAGTDRIPARPMTVLGEGDLDGLDEVVYFVIMQAMGEA